MTVKSYFTNAVHVAMRQALAELGEDALLLGVTRSAPESASLGAFEVVFGVPHAPAVSVEPEVIPSKQGEPVHEKGLTASALLDLQAQLQELRSLIQAPAAETSNLPGGHAEACSLHEQLVEVGFEGKLVSDLLLLASRAASTHEGKDLVSALRTEMKARVRPWQHRNKPRSSPLVMSFVGPPGAGKTLSLVKIAIRWGVTAKERVKIFFLEDKQVGSSRLLRHYASLLDLDCRPIHAGDPSPERLDSAGESDLVLIDTPGYGPLEAGRMSDAAALLARWNAAQTHLVLPATLRGEDLWATIERFQAFRPSALLFTRLDETTRYASIYMAAERFRYPLSFFSTGQQVPDDLVYATVDGIIGQAFWKDHAAVREAA